MFNRKQYTKAQVKFAAQPKPLYGRACVNWAGRTKPDKKSGDVGGEYYTELIAAAVLGNEDLYLSVPRYPIRSDFVFDGHDGTTIRDGSNRVEDRFCLARYARRDSEEKLVPFGRVINYQINIVPGQKVNVDLAAYDSTDKTLWLVEVKGNKDKTSDETLLRCVLEVYTYYTLLKNSLDTLVSTLRSADGECVPHRDRENTSVRCGVWIPRNSRPAREFAELDSRPNLKALIDRWKIRVEIFDPDILWL